jgi:exodeoxyribonuclease VIII
MSEDGRIVLAQEDRDRAFRVRDSIMAHPAARWIIQTKSAVEVSALWDCPETGVRCKLRADILGNGMAGDIKTTTDASPDSFMRTIASWSYHFQATHYINGLTALDLPIEHFCFIAVEKEEPFAVAVYRLRDDVLELVRPKLRGMLYKWKRCEEEGRWPAYSDEIQDIGIERWAAAKLEQI